MFRQITWMALLSALLVLLAGVSKCNAPDEDGDGYSADVDCNDQDASIHPGQEEPCACDGIDQNCNGIVDDFPCDMACPVDADKDGYTSDVDCNDQDASIHPGQEEPCTCDGVDQNCDGQIDNHPCDSKPCWLQQGDVCGLEGQPSCAPGYSCCYPCGIEGCQNVCTPTCTDEPWCAGGCPLYP